MPQVHREVETTSSTGGHHEVEWTGPITRVPYSVYQRDDIFDREQERIFRGSFWNYLCLEAELPDVGSFRSTFIGKTPVLVVRDDDGELYGFENRCAHRGTLLSLEPRGNAREFTCVYHAWRYSRQGDLNAVAFQDGLNGEGGMPSSFCPAEHFPRRMRVAIVFGLVFGTFSADAPDIDDYLGEEILGRIQRVLGGRSPVVLGQVTQMLPNNWKLYIENVKDSYHASILHLFFTTFGINRLSQRGGIIVDGSGGHHVSYSALSSQASKDGAYSSQGIRSDSQFQLRDPSLLESFNELGDDITLQILTVFPGFVLQQILNAIAVRQVLPIGVQETALHWTYLGFADDTDEQRAMRMKQLNLVGPAGYISMEDGCVGGFVQRGIAGSCAESSLIEMGGDRIESSSSRVTEAAIRGFWKVWRQAMETTRSER